MSGGSNQGTQVQNTSGTTSSNSITGPSPVLAPKLESVTDDLWKYYAGNANAPAYYPGSTVAPLGDRTQSALTALFDRGAAGSPYGKDVMANLGETMAGRYLDVDSNSYFQQALAAGFKPQTEQFMDEVVPGLDARFEGAGRYGSGLHADEGARAVESLNRAQADAAAKAASDAYGAERGRMLGAAGTAAGLAPALQAADYQDLAAMLQAGGIQDAQRQKEIDADVARYNYEQTAQPQWYARIAQLLQGIYPGGQTTGTGTSTSTGYTTTSASNSNPLEGLLGIGNLALKAYTASDARLKDVDRRVGFTDDGLPLYLYRYKGDDQPRIGPMAQEVAQLRPDAVAMHPSGYLMVDYKRATAPAGGLL